MKTLITVHASMTPPDKLLTREDIDKRDRKEGYRKCGFHYIIGRDGKVEAGRRNDEPSLHDFIKDADSTISICLIGGVDAKDVPADNFTVLQKRALEKQVSILVGRFPEMSNTLGVNLTSRIPALNTKTLTGWL